MAPALALLVALAVDRWLGEPREGLHPVVWMGRYLGWTGFWVQRRSGQSPGARDYTAFWLGALAWCAGAAMVLVVAWGLERAVLWVGSVSFMASLVAGLLLGLLLKPLLAWALLRSEVQAVEQALSGPGGSLGAGRARLRWLVSRDVAQLSAAQVRESAIETLAENLNDSVIAPLFWFVLLGLPGAALYRFANTADAMWGYRGVYQGQNWEWAGKWAARADDGLSWIPARLTAVLLWMAFACAPARGSAPAAWRRLRQEAGRTASPNSGWPMAAMALGLDVCLHKPGVYALNAGARAPAAADTTRALAFAHHSLIVPIAMAFIAMVVTAIYSIPGVSP